jgi:hypothetical protein
MAKRIIAGKKVKSYRNTVFTVPPGRPGDKAVMLHFGRAVGYDVVNLDTRGFPRRDRKGNKIIWVAGWGVTLKATGSPKSRKAPKFVRKVRYTAFVPRPRRKPVQWVCYDGRKLSYIPGPKYRGKKPPRAGMVQVEFNTGDPGVGYT